MKKFVFDTNALSMIIFRGVPEKWAADWRFVREGRAKLFLFEPLISEFYYKNIRAQSKKVAKDKILFLKGLIGDDVYQLDDNDALTAGELKIEHSQSDVSLVDSYILAVAKRHGAEILTTDPGIREVSKKLNIRVNFLPYPKT